MDLGLGGKIAIVTGGSKGIGRAVALTFVSEGASVLVCARGQQELDETVAAAGPGAAGRIAAAAADLTRGDQIETVVERCQAIYGGVIINVIGTGALRPAAGFMIGGAVNAALNHFTKSLADTGVKHGVRVVGVNPGPILTERLRRFMPAGEQAEKAMRRSTPLGRAGQPEEVADLVAFLASDRAAFIHGANVTIDGGSNPGLMG